MNIAFPFHFHHGRTATAENEAHIRDLIEQLIFTSQGERVNRIDFGSGLLQIIFAPNSPELASALQFSIQASINRWLGDLIEIHALEVKSEEEKLQILIQYVVRQTGESRSDSFELRGLG